MATVYPIFSRLRRKRTKASIRELIQETSLRASQLIMPYFVIPGLQKKEPLPSLPGLHAFSTDELLFSIEKLTEKGIRAVILFPVIPVEWKSATAEFCFIQNNFFLQALEQVRLHFPDLCLIVDVALDPFTSHGHDGIINEQGEVMNDETVELLARLAVLYGRSGVDFVAPSDMMDGRILYIRQQLDNQGLSHVGIISYAAKYSSSLYAPFRKALGSIQPQGIDKKGYQLNPANQREALLEAATDEKEGADILLIKPASLYLDILTLLRKKTLLPLAAYHVSGEYAMVMAAAEKNWLDPDRVFSESLLAIKRAGADFILTYAAKRVAQQLANIPLDKY